MACGTSGRTGSSSADQPEELEVEVVLARRAGVAPAKTARATPSTRKPSRGHRVDLLGDRARAARRRGGTDRRWPPARPWRRSAARAGRATARRATSPASRATAGSRRPASSRRAGARCRPAAAGRHRAMADSIGSKARRWLASTAYSSTACKCLRQARLRSAATVSCAAPSDQSRRTAMRLAVSVPVLSTHSTVVAPSSSTAGMLRASTFSRASRHAPRPRNSVSTTGNSSGRMAMASVRPASRPCSQSPRVSPQATARPAASARPTSRDAA